jgi:phage terminase large subunit-like protein
MFEYAGSGREQPIHISITTAGEDELGIWFEQRQYAERVNDGSIDDTSFLGVVYRVDPEKDDLEDPAVWKKANPSLNVIINEETFRNEYEKAKKSPSDLALFCRLRFGIIQRTEARFLRPEDWEKCSQAPRTAQDLMGRPCWLGCDLSQSLDLTALVSLHGTQEEGYDVDARFWMPAERVEFLEKRDHVPYENWIAQGWISVCPGEVISYEYIRLAILDLQSAYDLRGVGCDPWNATQWAVKLKEEDGINIQFVQQGFKSLSGPTKELERLVISNKFRHGNNPVLKWMVGNAVVIQDAAGNKKLDKAKSREKIDGLAALVNALALLASDPDAENTHESVYETRGILFV